MASKARTEAAIYRSLSHPEAALPAFRAWKLTERGVNHPVQTGPHESLAQAADAIAQRCDHKDRFAIHETHPVSGEQAVHFYEIKRESQRKWRRDPITGAEGWHQRLYHVHLFTTAVAAFTPVEPWRWEPGADVVGLDRGVIEQ